MPPNLPFLTVADPPVSAEGNLDPLGLYQIADQLATRLVPGVRERMQRIRMLTAIAVGSVLREGLGDSSDRPDEAPYLVWEWLVVDAFVRSLSERETLGIGGTLVIRRRARPLGYVDAKSYLKTPRIFGFHGVYKRLAMHLGVIDVHLERAAQSPALIDAWSKGLVGGRSTRHELFDVWKRALRRSSEEDPRRTRASWNSETWASLARAFAPFEARAAEKRFVRSLLLSQPPEAAGALNTIWKLQRPNATGYAEEDLHREVERRAPQFVPLIRAVRAYETFARQLQDAFDLIRFAGTLADARGFTITDIGTDRRFQRAAKSVHRSYVTAWRRLDELPVTATLSSQLFEKRFQSFAERLDPGELALQLCSHHEGVQKAKSNDGKRPWFDRIGQNRIYMRHKYRIAECQPRPGKYVHEYRASPIRRFWQDLV